MKVVHLSATGTQGGAGVAMRRLHEGLLRQGVESRLLDVAALRTAAALAGQTPRRALDLELAQTLFADANRTPVSNTLFSLGVPGPVVFDHPHVRSADVIHLHWINGLLGIPDIGALLASGKQIAWTLHDQWAFTGGCHYSAGCEGYRTACEHCPQLRFAPDVLARAVLEDKLGLWAERRRLQLVVLTEWMEHCARQSRLLADSRPARVPNGIDLDVFSPQRRDAARAARGVRPDQVVFLVASQSIREVRKGYQVVQEALRRCVAASAIPAAGFGDRLVLACIGHDRDPNCPVPMQHWGWSDDEGALADCYAAADVLLAPSLEDNLPNTVVEALACGTPVIGAAAGGIPEMVADGITGSLVPAGDADALARAIQDLALHPGHYEAMRPACRQFAEQNYSHVANAGRMIEVYR